MSLTENFNLVRITIGNEENCPNGEREEYQLFNNCYTTGNIKNIPKKILDELPTHAIVYYSKKGFKNKPWLAGQFKGIYEIKERIHINTKQIYDSYYPKGWWGLSQYKDKYNNYTWTKECGFKLKQITDSVIPELSTCRNIRGDIRSMMNGNSIRYANLVKKRIEMCSGIGTEDGEPKYY